MAWYRRLECTSSAYGQDVISRYWSKSAIIIGGLVTLSANYTWKGALLPNGSWCQKPRLFLLRYSEDCMILSSFIWIGYQRVTDRQTELPWLIQRSALQAMRPRCNYGKVHNRYNVLNLSSSTSRRPMTIGNLSEPQRSK